MWSEQHFYSFGQIQTSQTGGQPYSDTYPYGESSLGREALTLTSGRKSWYGAPVWAVRISRPSGSTLAGEASDLVDASGSWTARVRLTLVDVDTLWVQVGAFY